MQPRIAAPPGPAERTRRGEAAVADHHHLAGPDAGGAGVEAGVVGDTDRPAAVRRIPRHPEVTAQVDQDASAHGGLDRGGRPVGGQSLGGGTQVEQYPGRDAHRRVTAIEFDPAPAARGHRRLAQGVGALAGQGEVPVVAEPGQALPAGGIDITVGEFGRVQRDGQRVREQRADLDRAAAGVVDPRQLRIVAEP